MPKPQNLEPLSTLLANRSSTLKRTISNLKKEDLEKDSALRSTIDSLKKNTLLNEVVFKEPKIENHEIIPKKYPNNPEYRGAVINEYHVTVVFPFKGSEELFYHIGEGERFASGTIYEPIGSNVTIGVNVRELDKGQVFSSAREKMKPTFDIIKINNSKIKDWNEKTNTMIEELLTEQRKKVIDFYS